MLQRYTTAAANYARRARLVRLSCILFPRNTKNIFYLSSESFFASAPLPPMSSAYNNIKNNGGGGGGRVKQSPRSVPGTTGARWSARAAGTLTSTAATAYNYKRNDHPPFVVTVRLRNALQRGSAAWGGPVAASRRRCVRMPNAKGDGSGAGRRRTQYILKKKKLKKLPSQFSITYITP